MKSDSITKRRTEDMSRDELAEIIELLETEIEKLKKEVQRLKGELVKVGWPS